jgi:hypothetical protein
VLVYLLGMEGISSLPNSYQIENTNKSIQAGGWTTTSRIRPLELCKKIDTIFYFSLGSGYAIALNSNDKIVVAGTNLYRFTVLRFHP